MIKNYFKIAIRTLFRSPGYSAINIVGLSVGIATSLLILLWVHDELTYNQYFTGYDRIHSIMINSRLENGTATRNYVPMPLKDVLLEQDSRIKRYSIVISQDALLTLGENRLKRAGLDVSESFLQIFDFKMIAGNRESALKEKQSIVLTRPLAKALFGNEDPLGKMVQIKNGKNQELKVTGVLDDLPSNISFQFDFLLPFSYFETYSDWVQHARGNWNNNAFEIYVELQPDADKASVDNAIRNLVKKNVSDNQDKELFLHPMSRWRLHDKFENGKEAGGNIEYVELFSVIAIFILIIACINFMNLSTARSEHRAREVGIRKSVGSGRRELIIQFFGESVLISILAFLISIVLVEITLPFYNTLVEKQLSIDYASPLFWLFGISLVLVTGVLAGSYPALYLSSFRPVQVLKGKVMIDKKGATPRQVMVTLQFCFSILLMIGTIVIYQQIQYLKAREPGYDRENLMMIWTTSDIEKNFRMIKEELIHSGNAVSVCKSNSPITNIFASSPLDSWTGMQAGQRMEVVNIATEYDYTKTMGIKMLEGRDFSEAFKSDTSAAVINKAAVKILGLGNPIGDKIKMWGSTFTIIGVMDDVVMGASSNTVAPLVMTMDPNWSSTITVRLPKTKDLTGEISRMAASFKKYNPDYTFEYRFADAEFEKKFGNLNMISGLAASFAGLAIFITGLGLLGMAAFSAEQRTKEIGIRKVLGASVSGLVLLMTKDFSRLVIVSFIIAAPLAGWAANNFLQQYQVHTSISLWIYPLTGLAALVSTLLIVSTQAVRVAGNNPVKALRSE